MRVASVAAVAVLLAASNTAVATPRPSSYAPPCGVVDEAGDVASHLGSSALDILSADSVVGRTELFAVLRLPTTDTSNDTARKLGGYEWSVRYRADGIDYSFRYRSSGLFSERKESAVSVGPKTPPHVVTVGPTSIIWKVKRSDLPAPGPRSAWVEIEVSTHDVEGTADSATGRVRRAGCRLP